MSHGTVHDNSPKARPWVGMIELKIHFDSDRIRRRKFYDESCKYKRSANPRWLPRYLPCIGGTSELRNDVEVSWKDPITEYNLILPNDLKKLLTDANQDASASEGYPRIGVIVNPVPDTVWEPEDNIHSR